MLVLATSVLLAACGSTHVARPLDARAKLLALHEEVMQAHRESNVDLLLRSEAPDSVSANRGEITQPTLDARRARFQQYLGSTRFAEYVDVVPPIVRVSDDGSLGWWIELYERRADTWYRAGNVSNFKP